MESALNYLNVNVTSYTVNQNSQTMKKACLLTLAFVFFLFFSFPEIKAEDKMIYRDHNLLGGGISLGYLGTGFMGTRSIGVPPLSAYYETGVHDFITAGPYLGFARWSYRYAVADYRYSWTFINAGGRGSFHLTGFLNEVFDMGMDEEKIDWYVTLFVGMEFRRYSSSGDWVGSTYGNTSRFFIGPSTGVRYYISDNMAIFAEGGYSAFGAFTFGVSFRR